MVPKICSANECDSPAVSKQLCSKHYQRLRNTGKLDLDRPTLVDRFWKKVDKTESCWIWMASRDRSGYGHIGITGATTESPRLAHRVSWEWAKGPIPNGMQVDHTCHTPACVKPDHLRLATNKQNGENRSGPQVNSKTGVRGVSPVTGGRFQATVGHNKKLFHLGYFDTIEEASEVVTAKRNELFTHNHLDRAA